VVLAQQEGRTIMSATLTAVKPIAPVDEPVVAAPIPTYVTRFDARAAGCTSSS
jgi:hypothetical protein